METNNVASENKPGQGADDTPNVGGYTLKEMNHKKACELILQFLKEHDYQETLKAFERETYVLRCYLSCLMLYLPI